MNEMPVNGLRKNAGSTHAKMHSVVVKMASMKNTIMKKLPGEAAECCLVAVVGQDSQHIIHALEGFLCLCVIAEIWHEAGKDHTTKGNLR